MSMNEASWPIFIAAPFISPSVRTIFSAVSTMARLELLRGALLRARRPLAALRARVAAAWPPSAVPSFAERRVRPFGIFMSSATGAGYPWLRSATPYNSSG